MNVIHENSEMEEIQKMSMSTCSNAVGKTRPTAPVVLEDAVRVGKSEDLELKVPSVA